MIYRGERIYFRLLEPTDVEMVMHWENNPINWKQSGINKPYTLAEIEDFVLSNHDIFEHKQLRLMVCLKDSHSVIGHIDFFDFEPQQKRLGVGILIEDNYRQQGFAKETLFYAEEYAKLILNVKNVFSHVLSDNIPSIHLFEKMGFQKVGVKPNWHFYHGKWYDEILYVKSIN